jgi:hypothetical protein
MNGLGLIGKNNDINNEKMRNKKKQKKKREKKDKIIQFAIVVK